MRKPSVQLAKLSRPGLQPVAARDRLLATMDKARACPSLWIAGPAGAGKTTLVSAFVESRSLDHLWLQLDASDADPATFFCFLRQAAQNISSRAYATLPLFAQEHVSDPISFTRRWFRELFEARPLVIVLDNLQELASDCVVHRILAEAIGEAPARSQLVLISRSAPAPAYARQLANGKVCVFDREQLRLTLDEARQIGGAENIDDESLRRIHHLCGGWATGLHALIKHSSHVDAVADSGEVKLPQELLNYFAIEVLAKADKASQSLLLRLSALPRFSGEVACSLSGNSDAVQLLQDMHVRLGFVERGSGFAAEAAERQVFQFHGLFRAFLRHEALRTFGRATLREMDAHAAKLLESEGAAEEAIPLFLDAEQWREARRLILVAAPILVVQDRGRQLESWAVRLPMSTSNDCWLLYWRGLARSNADPVAARELLQRAFATSQSQIARDIVCEVQAAAAIVDLIFLSYTQFDELDRWIPVLEDALEQDARVVGIETDQRRRAELELRARTAALAAIMYRRGDQPQLQQHIARILVLLRSEVDINVRVAAGTQLLSYASNFGNFSLSLRALPMVERLLLQEGVAPRRQALCAYFIAWCHLNIPDPAKTRQSVSHIEAIAAASGLTSVRRYSAIIAFWSEMSQQRVEGMARWLAVLEEVMDPAVPYDAASANLMHALLHLAKAQPHRALPHAREAVRLYEELGSPWHRLLGWGVMARTCLECGEHIEAERLFEHAYQLSHAMRLRPFALHRLQARAWIARMRHDVVSYRDSLTDLFEAAQEFDCHHAPRFFPQWMSVLCADALELNVCPEYVRRLVQEWNWAPPDATQQHWPWTVCVRTLGAFEIQTRDGLLQFTRKSPARLLTVLKAIIALGSVGVSEQQLIEAVWPDEEGDGGAAALHVSLTRLRKLLGCSEVVRLSEGRVSLNLDLCWIDALAFERISSSVCEGRVALLSPENLAAAESACSLYRGNFLPADPDASWALARRETLRNRVIHLVERLTAHYEHQRNWQRAIALYRQGLETDPLFERFHQGLIHCYLQLDQHAEALSAYRQMRLTLSVVLSIEPSPRSEALYRKIYRQCLDAPGTSLDAERNEAVTASFF